MSNVTNVTKLNVSGITGVTFSLDQLAGPFESGRTVVVKPDQLEAWLAQNGLPSPAVLPEKERRDV